MSVLYLPLLLSILAFLISIISFLYLKSWLRRRTAKEWVLSEIEEEVSRILNTLDETTVRDISLIEEREKRIKALLVDIDKRLKVYVREVDSRNEAEENYTVLVEAAKGRKQDDNAYRDLGKNRGRLNINRDLAGSSGKKSPDGTVSDIIKTDTPNAESVPGNTRTQDSEDAAFPLPRFRVKQESKSNDNAAKPAAPKEPGSAETPALRIQIGELIQEGLSAPAIASRLGISIAEVEFVAALLERRD